MILRCAQDDKISFYLEHAIERTPQELQGTVHARRYGGLGIFLIDAGNDKFKDHAEARADYTGNFGTGGEAF